MSRRLSQGLRKMSAGTIGGQSRAASRVNTRSLRTLQTTASPEIGEAPVVPVLCPVLFTSGSHGFPAGLGAAGDLLYTVYTSGIDVRNFPALTFNSDVDLDPAMNNLGAGGGGNIRAATLDGSNNLYAVGFITTGASLDIMKVEVDGTGEVLLTTLASSGGLAPQITWHPADPDNLYVLYDDDGGGSVLVTVHRTTGATSTVSTFVGGGFGQFNQWDGGLVFFEGGGLPMAGNIWVYDFAAFDSLAVTSYGGHGTRPDGHTLWIEDLNNADTGVYAFDITAGPTIVTTTVACGSDPWLSSEPIYWFATPDRSQVYISDGFYVWNWA